MTVRFSLYIHLGCHFEFDFTLVLEVKLPNTKDLNVLGIDVQQRIAVLPIMNSMLIRQQRSNGSSTRVYSAHTTMRYRLIEKDNYTVLPVCYTRSCDL